MKLYNFDLLAYPHVPADAPRTPVALVRCRQDSGNVREGIERLAISDLHSSCPGGRPGTALWAAGPAGRRVVVFAGLSVRHPQRFPLGGLPAVWWFLGSPCGDSCQ